MTVNSNNEDTSYSLSTIVVEPLNLQTDLVVTAEAICIFCDLLLTHRLTFMQCSLIKRLQNLNIIQIFQILVKTKTSEIKK